MELTGLALLAGVQKDSDQQKKSSTLRTTESSGLSISVACVWKRLHVSDWSEETGVDAKWRLWSAFRTRTTRTTTTIQFGEAPF